MTFVLLLSTDGTILRPISGSKQNQTLKKHVCRHGDVTLRTLDLWSRGRAWVQLLVGSLASFCGQVTAWGR